VALADPELDLLKEILSEDPADPACLDVGREYVRRAAWHEAIRVLSAGTEAGLDEQEAWSLLAVATFNADQFLRSLAAVERFGADVQHSDLLSRIQVLALERSGQIAAAGNAAAVHLGRFPDDEDVQSASERLFRSGPTPGAVLRALDPMMTPARAEAYVAVGRVDRAVRLYRRLLFHDPSDLKVKRRLRELEGDDIDLPDDLSEELTADMDAQRPPGLLMPKPGAATPAPLPARSSASAPFTTTHGGHSLNDWDSAITAVPAIPRSGSDDAREEGDEDVSLAEIAQAIDAHRRATGTPRVRSVVPGDGAQLTVSEDILKAAEEIDAEELRARIRAARERRGGRRSLIRK